MNTFLMKFTSSAFLKTADLCMKEYRDSLDSQNNVKLEMVFPAVVNYAFSAELGLKYILAINGQKARGHDLYDLLLKLESKQIEEIVAPIPGTLEVVVKHLLVAREAFKEWRYVYEFDRERGVNVDFLRDFATSIDTLATKLMEPKA